MPNQIIRAGTVLAEDINTTRLTVKGCDISKIVADGNALAGYDQQLQALRKDKGALEQQAAALRTEFAQLKALVNWSADTLEQLARGQGKAS